MAEAVRVHYQEELEQLEASALGGLDLVSAALERTLEAVEHQDVELAQLVIADDDRIDGRYLEVHQSLIALLATQSPVATDLRLISALLHVLKNVERMGDQCVNVCKMIPLSGNEPPADEEMVKRILTMGRQTRTLIGQAKRAFEERDVEMARDLVRQDDVVDNLNRECFRPGAGDRRRRRQARVGDDDAAGGAGDRADRRQRGRHRRAGRLRRHRALPRVRGRLAPAVGRLQIRAVWEHAKSPGMLCAAIDIGSNTTRVLVAEPVDGQLKKVMEQRAYTRINKALGDDGAILPEKVDEVAEVVATQVRLARELGAETIRSVATAAVREASNGELVGEGDRRGLRGRRSTSSARRRRGGSPSSARPRRSATRSRGRSASSTSAAARPR